MNETVETLKEELSFARDRINKLQDELTALHDADQSVAALWQGIANKEKQRAEKAEARLAHFVNPDTLPKSIDDATIREWDLSSELDRERKRAEKAEAERDARAEDMRAATRRAEKAEAELEKAYSEITKLERKACYVEMQQLRPALGRIEELTYELAALREDKERLDWLENNPLSIGWRLNNLEGLFVFCRNPYGDPDTNLSTFRAAIDAARKEGV